MDLGRYGARYLNVEAFEHWAMTKRTSNPRRDGMTVEIVGVDLEEMWDPDSRKMVNNPVMYIEGADRGIVLTGALIETIRQALGTYESDDWIGHKIGIRIVTIQKKDCLRAFRVQPDAKQRADSAPLGEKKARAVVARLRQLETSWDAFLAHMAIKHPPLPKGKKSRYDLLLGIEIADAPNWVIDEIKAWLESPE